jgi:hypothetical protein
VRACCQLADIEQPCIMLIKVLMHAPWMT